jgi:hypothetical protein
MAVPHIQVRSGNPDFLDLPWDDPIDSWDGDRIVEMPVGIHRHPVVFVAYPEGIYAIKELPLRLARHEFEVLRLLAERTTRSARVAGLVERPWADPHEEYSAAVITRFVDYAFPYRELLSGGGFGQRREQLLDAFAGLLVELHLAGCFWGDCSLSNVLYRYDAGAIAAIMVDGETARLHDILSRGQRFEDIEIMRINVAGEMADVAAADGLDLDEADLDLGADIAARYVALWNELNEELVIGPDERYRIRSRIHRLNDLGFSVDDVDLEPAGTSSLVRMKVTVGGRTYNSQRLRELTGIDASENQARQILSDVRYHDAKTMSRSSTGKEVATMQWRASVFEPMVRQVAETRPGDPIQGYCDFLHHRYSLAVEQGRDIGNDEAYASWVAAGYPGYPLEITSASATPLP